MERELGGQRSSFLFFTWLYLALLVQNAPHMERELGGQRSSFLFFTWLYLALLVQNAPHMERELEDKGPLDLLGFPWLY
jgi:hypothetical protein